MLKQKQKTTCPRCGQHQYPFRYNICPICQYKFSNLYVRDDIKLPSLDVYNRDVAKPAYRRDLAELYD